MASVKLEPWEAYPDIWKTRAAFFAYLRGGLRLIWSRFPGKLNWKKSQMTTVPPVGYTGRGKSFGKCYYCRNMFNASALEVDHVSQAGTCNSWETAQEFLHNLLDCNDNWVLACKPCHKVKSLAERNGSSFEEALIQKQVIEFMRRPVKEIVAFCQENGYTSSSLKNAKSRREAVTTIFNKEIE